MWPRRPSFIGYSTAVVVSSRNGQMPDSLQHTEHTTGSTVSCTAPVRNEEEHNTSAPRPRIARARPAPHPPADVVRRHGRQVVRRQQRPQDPRRSPAPRRAKRKGSLWCALSLDSLSPRRRSRASRCAAAAAERPRQLASPPPPSRHTPPLTPLRGRAAARRPPAAAALLLARADGALTPPR